MGRKAFGNIKHQRGKSLAFLRGIYLGSFDNDADAQERIDARLLIDAGTVPDSASTYGEAWMDKRETDGEVRGFAEERSVWTNHVATARWYDWPLKKVTPKDITAWLLALSKKRKTIVTRTRDGVTRRPSDETLGRQAVLHARRLAYGMFEAALGDNKLPANPVAASKMPKMESGAADEEADEWTFLFVEEIKALFDAIEQIVPLDPSRLKPATLARLEQRRAFYRAVYAIAIYGGLRQGEIFGLDWEDISFEQRGGGDRTNCIRVRRTRNMGRSPKTKSSKRSVPMLAPLRNALDQWRRHGGVVKTHGKVFPADGSAGQGRKPKELGGYFGRSYDAAWEVRWRARATDRDFVTFYDLRHTCASHLVMGNWGLPLTELQVMKWLGHSDLKTTQRYMHLAPGSLNELVRQMETSAADEQALHDTVRRMELARRAPKQGR